MVKVPWVFVSSTYKDLKKERRKVQDAIVSLKYLPLGMERFPASDASQWAIIEDEIESCDFYVVIIGGRYGSIDVKSENKISFTEKEYDLALLKGKRIIPFLHKNPDNLLGKQLEKSDDGRKKLEAFRKKIEDRHHCKYWKNSSELAGQVTQSLTHLANTPQTPQTAVVSFEAKGESKDQTNVSTSKDLKAEKETVKPAIHHILTPQENQNLELAPRPKNPTKSSSVNNTLRNNNFRSGRFEQTFIDELKARADIVRVVEGYVPLKKKGQNWWAPCPFHGEKTASFSVNPGKGMFKCFGCGKGGNVFTFVMELEGLSFPEAIKVVAEKEGVPLPELVDGNDYEQSKKATEERKRIVSEVIQLNEWATEFWENYLLDAKAKHVREYLEQRGITEETIKAFKLGYSPDSWDALKSYLKEMGAGEKQIEISGLVGINEEKGRVFDRFRGRIMFPVLDVNGKPIAFGARAMGDDQPKYLNSPETPAYTKGNHLYGLFQAREEIRKKKFAILVEGYFDLITPYQFGVKNCVASSGTAFTEAQAKLLKRFARKVLVNYDGDSAGVTAARKAIGPLLAEDFEIKILVLPEGSDPDEFIQTNGVEAYNKHRGQAAPHLQFVLEQAVRDKNLGVPRHKAAAIEEIIPVLCAVRNPTEQRESFDQAMSFLRVDEPALRNDLWQTVKAGSKVDPVAMKRQIARSVRVKVTVAEQQLLEMLVHDDELRKIILPTLEESDYEALASASLFQALIEADKRSLGITAETLSALLDEDNTTAHDMLPLLMMSNAPRAEGEVIDVALSEAENRVVTLRLMAIHERLLRMHQEQQYAEEKGDTETFEKLAIERVKLERLEYDLEQMIKQHLLQ